MKRTIIRIGNSQGVMLDSALKDQAVVKVGDQVTITVHQGGSIVLTPVKPVIHKENASAISRRLILSNAELFRRLS